MYKHRFDPSPIKGGKDQYLIPVGDDAYLMISVENYEDSDALFARVKAGRGMNHAASEDIAESEDGQNPVMNFIGEYQCERAHALVECSGTDEAQITIEWGSSASELARWIIVGRLDTGTLTVAYSGCTKSIVTFDENGEEVSQVPEYEDGSGTIVFNDDGTFTWHEDQSEYENDMVFEWAPA